MRQGIGHFPEPCEDSEIGERRRGLLHTKSIIYGENGRWGKWEAVIGEGHSVVLRVNHSS